MLKTINQNENRNQLAEIKLKFIYIMFDYKILYMA